MTFQPATTNLTTHLERDIMTKARKTKATAALWNILIGAGALAILAGILVFGVGLAMPDKSGWTTAAIGIGVVLWGISAHSIGRFGVWWSRG